MRATIDNIEGGGGEDERRLDTSEIGKVLVKGDTLLSSTGLSDCDGHAENSISAELALIRGTIKFDKEIIDIFLVEDGETRLDEFRCDDVVDVGDSLADTYQARF